jgi:cation diffusion facilitator family transporter
MTKEMASGSRRVVYAALAVDVLILAGKGAAALLTGSSAMLAETFHSAVDTGNTLLLLLGEHLSRKPPDELHPFGYGKALYFWSFVVAVSMFAVGGVMSIFEGIHHLVHYLPIESSYWAYIVLGASAVFSVVSLVIGLREVNRHRGSESVLQFVRRSKDPSVFTVVLGDVGDILGNLTAMLTIYLATTLHMPHLDGAGSILIGLAMMGISALLANESRGLLIGESADRKQVEAIKKLVTSDPAVERLGKLLTMQLGPEEVLLNLEVDFRTQGSIEALELTIDRLTRQIQKAYPMVKQVYLEAASLQSTPTQKKAS